MTAADPSTMQYFYNDFVVTDDDDHDDDDDDGIRQVTSSLKLVRPRPERLVYSSFQVFCRMIKIYTVLH